MAKPIGKTPVFEGKDAVAVLKKMQQPPTKKDKEFAKKLGIKELFYFNFVGFSFKSKKHYVYFFF